jgi:hypothetical protein
MAERTNDVEATAGLRGQDHAHVLTPTELGPNHAG